MMSDPNVLRSRRLMRSVRSAVQIDPPGPQGKETAVARDSKQPHSKPLGLRIRLGKMRSTAPMWRNGRRNGLKIRFYESGVWVRVPPSAPSEKPFYEGEIS